MLFRKINADLHLSLTVPSYAREIFSLTDTNRAFLRNWMPWLDDVNRIEHTEDFIKKQLDFFANGLALHLTIFYKNQMAGCIGFNRIDIINDIAYIGYWLGREYNGKGIMTAAVNELIRLGFEYYSLQKVEIHCACENYKSRAIPERLNFVNEGRIRRAEKVYERYLDLFVYGLLREEFEGTSAQTV